MAATVTGSVAPAVSVNSSDVSVSGFNNSQAIQIPPALAALQFATGTGAQQISIASYNAGRALTASTPVTDDLSALTGYVGATAYTKVKILAITNNDTVAGHNVVFSGGASNPFVGKLGGTTPTHTIGPGETLLMFDLTAAGMTVDGTHKTIKLDPGANNISSVSIVVAGNP
jgi:hypothetical protein